tara:strand:+ start:1923 stop:2348 length:426 start_codon:yes stop_codon:yes gene_type:complete
MTSPLPKQKSVGTPISSIKKYMYLGVGFISLFLAYIGVITPGVPFTGFLIIAAWAFSKSSKKWHDYLYSHKIFGPFITNWESERVFPKKARNMMIISMYLSSLICWFSTKSIPITSLVVSIMIVTIIWTKRFPEQPTKIIP